MTLASKTELEKWSLFNIFWCFEHGQMCFFEDKVVSFETFEGELLWPDNQTKAFSFRTQLDQSKFIANPINGLQNVNTYSSR